MTPPVLERIQRLLTPKLTKYIPHIPTVKQAAFLLLNCREALYGGAAGGGKSDALLAAALQYVDVPGYAALLLRRTFRDLSLPGALMVRAHQWLDGTDATWDDGEKTWHFPSGATITFGYLETDKDRFRYQSAEFQFIGFDELTQFSEKQYRYLFSRLRRLKDVAIPIRMRSATNPGGIGGPWVYQRFLVEGHGSGRVFIPANLKDNPHLDQAEYIESLNELDPVTKAQLLSGNWEIRESGGKFDRGWFRLIPNMPADPKKQLKWVRFWDLASTEPKKGKDPDYTVGTLGTEIDGQYVFADVRRKRLSAKGIEDLISQTAAEDKARFGDRVETVIEQEGGSAGKNLISLYQRTILKGYTTYGSHPTQKKELRANPVASAAEAGNVLLVTGPWITEFLDEFELFPLGDHDDQVDTVSGIVDRINKPKPKKKAGSFTWAGGSN